MLPQLQYCVSVILLLMSPVSTSTKTDDSSWSAFFKKALDNSFCDDILSKKVTVIGLWEEELTKSQRLLLIMDDGRMMDANWSMVWNAEREQITLIQDEFKLFNETFINWNVKLTFGAVVWSQDFDAHLVLMQNESLKFKHTYSAFNLYTAEYLDTFQAICSAKMRPLSDLNRFLIIGKNSDDKLCLDNYAINDKRQEPICAGYYNQIFPSDSKNLGAAFMMNSTHGYALVRSENHRHSDTIYPFTFENNVFRVITRPIANQVFFSCTTKFVTTFMYFLLGVFVIIILSVLYCFLWLPSNKDEHPAEEAFYNKKARMPSDNGFRFFMDRKKRRSGPSRASMLEAPRPTLGDGRKKPRVKAEDIFKKPLPPTDSKYQRKGRSPKRKLKPKPPTSVAPTRKKTPPEGSSDLITMPRSMGPDPSTVTPTTITTTTTEGHQGKVPSKVVPNKRPQQAGKQKSQVKEPESAAQPPIAAQSEKNKPNRPASTTPKTEHNSSPDSKEPKEPQPSSSDGSPS